MKHIKKIPIKWQFTILSGSLILITSLSLNLVSLYNAKRSFNLLEVENTKTINTYFSVDAITAAKPDGIFDSANGVLVDEIKLTPDTNLSQVIDFNPVYSKMNVTSANVNTKFNYTNYIFTFLIASVGMLITYLISNRLLKPINALSTTIESISEHNQYTMLPVDESTSEINKLSYAFNKMMKELDDSYDKQKEFSTSIAHELKTPLATLKAGVQTLNVNDNPSIEEYQQVVKIANKNIERLISVVDDLFLLTSTEVTNDEEIISIEATLKSILNELNLVYHDKEIKQIFDFEENEHFILSNETLMYRSFYNLIENALKYSNVGGLINLKCNCNEDFISVEIKDNGIGISEKDLPLIFDSFYCVDMSRSRKLGGAGLGLSIVKSIMDKENWEIMVESKLNVGTTFKILIPVSCLVENS